MKVEIEFVFEAYKIKSNFIDNALVEELLLLAFLKSS